MVFTFSSVVLLHMKLPGALRREYESMGDGDRDRFDSTENLGKYFAQ